MILEKRIITFCFGLFASLLLLFVTGCNTPQDSHIVSPGSKNYRKVYLVMPKVDPREVAPRILSRLQLAGFDVTEISAEAAKDLTKKSSKEVQEAPALLCKFHYVSLGDRVLENDFRFQTIRIQFYDLEKNTPVFEVNRFKYNPSVPENAELKRLFSKISDHFFAEQPNPFTGNQ